MSRIGFFTLNAYDMLTGGHEGDTVGGAQLQQILVGRELAARGHDVYFVEYDAEYKREQCVDGIEVVTKPEPTGSQLSRARTVVQGTWDVLRRIEPDVCYRRSFDFEMLPLAAYSNVSDNRFVYGIAHDKEVSGTIHKFEGTIKGTRAYSWLNHRALSAASTVIAQNPTQLKLAREQLQTNVVEIPNCYPGDRAEPVDWPYDPPVVFWAARFVEWKQPDIVLDLARSLPDVTFVMAGGPGDEQLLKRFTEQSADCDNLELLGHVPFTEIDRYFSAADLLLNTSEAEGFPNTFLQAWANKTPVVSLQVDPGDILAREGIGVVADGSPIRLRDQISDLARDSARIGELGERSYQYLSTHHSVETITDQYERVFVSSEQSA